MVERVRHYLWDQSSWGDIWRPWFGAKNWEFDGALVLYQPPLVGGLRSRNFPTFSHNGEVRRRWRPVGADPDSSSESDDGMPTTIDGLAGQNNGVLRDMWAAGNEQVRAYCLQLTRPTLDQIRDITLRAEPSSVVMHTYGRVKWPSCIAQVPRR